MASITRTSQTSRARRRIEIRQQLLQAVDRCLESTSFTELSVERLVREAGIARSTFYVYFEDKEDLLGALAEDVIDGVIEAASYWWQLPADATKADLREAMERIADTYRTHRVVMAAVVEATAYDAQIAEQLGALVQRARDAVAEHVRHGQEHGYVDPSVDPAQAATWLTWMTERGLLQLISPASAEDTELLMRSLTDVVWNVLYAATR